MNVVALFLKAPIPGAVKTRLAESLGDEGALKAYCELVEFLLRRIPDAMVHVHYTPNELSLMEDWLGRSYDYVLQEGPGLGERLINAMEGEFDAGAEKLIFLGGDCPFVDQECLDEAFTVLDEKDVVIGPAVDGGYYLIGLKTVQRGVFEGISWGGDTVFRSTLDCCRELGLTVGLLPEKSDVDDLSSWETAKQYMNRA